MLPAVFLTYWCFSTGKLDSIDDASVGSQKSNVSIKSIDSVASMEVHVIANIRHPPKNLVLAATACVILLTPGNEVRV